MDSASGVVLEADGEKHRFLAFFHAVLLLISLLFVLFEAGPVTLYNSSLP